MDHLHITNGDVAAGILQEAGIAGEVLPWRDVLHEGPVPASLALAELSRVRARFIADCGWASFEAAAEDFRARDAVLVACQERSEVTLWFEHDLYDQLQLLQLLDWFSAQPPGSARPTMICIDEYLGRLSAAKMAALFPTRAPVTDAQLELGRRAWRAFRAPEPEAWQALMDEDTSALPFLADAVLRHLEQFPSTENGLNRTESQLLEAVRAGRHSPGQVFAAVQATEERAFMGDWSFFLCMKALFDGTPPLLQTRSGAAFRVPGQHAAPIDPTGFGSQEIVLTDAGERVLRGELDWCTVSRLDTWLGGVHLTATNLRRWDHQNLCLQPVSESAESTLRG